jgi:hypothetical protein
MTAAEEAVLEDALEDDITEDDTIKGDIIEDARKDEIDMVALLAGWAEEEEPPAAAPPDAPLTARTPP